MPFQIHALPESLFAEAFAMPDEALAAISARRMVVDSCPDFPCRVSLEDAPVGETVLLINYQHQPNSTPYQAAHAVFVRQGAVEAKPAPGDVPLALRSRLLSVRAFDINHDMVEADVVDGMELERVIEQLFANPAAEYLHIHNAKQGCYHAGVRRLMV